MGSLIIKGITIGEGVPKTIVPLTGLTPTARADSIMEGKKACADCFEWRADFSLSARRPEQAASEACAMATLIPKNPLLFTMRSIAQGGQGNLLPDDYSSLNRAVIRSGAIDLVDIELSIGDRAVRDLVDYAHAHDVRVLVSHHDFQGTPSVGRMVDQLTHMLALGADIPKLAVMAKSAEDALSLMTATEQVHRLYADVPLLTVSMGDSGRITRIAGEFFGSALTFCALNESSAPGQINIAETRALIDSLHHIVTG